MKTLLTATLVAFAITTAPALAQTSTTTAKPAGEAAVEAKFKAADKNGNGTLEGAELDAYKASLAQIDANKDGKVSMVEFAAAAKTGIVK